MSFPDFPFGSGSSMLILIFIVCGQWRYFLMNFKFFFCTVNFISSSPTFNFLFSVHTLYFPKFLSAVCEIMVFMFLYSNTLLLLSRIACSFCWILCLQSHLILCHWVIWFYSRVNFLYVQCSWVNVTILVEILI